MKTASLPSFDLTLSSFPVDPHLGLASTLWPACYLVGHAISSKEMIDGVRATHPLNVPAYEVGFNIMASTITDLLTEWVLPSVNTESMRTKDFDGESERCDSIEWFADSIEFHSHSALALRHSVLVFFDRIVLQHGKEFPRIRKNVHISLTHCAAAVHSGGPLNALLWPLTIASREAITEEDKDLAKSSFEILKVRRALGNAERAWASVLFTWSESESPSVQEEQQREVGSFERRGWDLILV